MTLASARHVRYRSPGHPEQDRPSRARAILMSARFSGEAHV